MKAHRLLKVLITRITENESVPCCCVHEKNQSQFSIMEKHENGTTGKTYIMQEILAYLSEHPDAQDTLEGVAEWWLLRQKVRHKSQKVKEVLSELTTKGLILEYKGKDRHTYYRVNRSRYEEIKAMKQKT